MGCVIIFVMYNIPPETTVPTPTPQPPVEPVKPNNPKLLLTSLIVLEIITLSVAGYFEYQYSQLKKQISDNQVVPTSTPTATAQPINTSPSPQTDNQQLLKYDSKFITFNYPKSLYEWSFGRGVNLEYFQINSVNSDNQMSQNRVSIVFDIHVPQYKPQQTLEEMRQAITQYQKDYPEQHYVMSNRKIDGIDALVIESTADNVPSSEIAYTKKVWIRKNNVVYEIDFIVVGESIAKRDALKTQYSPIFEDILTSVKLKYVDPAEVERLGNHPD